MQGSLVQYPELWMEVYIAGDEYEERAFAQMLVQACCSRADTPDEADLVIFTGGVDVDPQLYGEVPHPMTERPNHSRDQQDILLWHECVEKGIPMMGVCRGAQFGAVMKGAKLFQHVDNHNSPHSIWDLKKSFLIDKISSVHHQMVRPHSEMEVLADTLTSKVRWKNNLEKSVGTDRDIEAFWYEDVAFLGIQGHPEYIGYSRYTKWCLEQINTYIIENPRIELKDRVRRIKEEFRIGSEVNKALEELV